MHKFSPAHFGHTLAAIFFSRKLTRTQWAPRPSYEFSKMSWNRNGNFWAIAKVNKDVEIQRRLALIMVHIC